jgi:pimeloyl-ACP methyl ester carboxylesterase
MTPFHPLPRWVRANGVEFAYLEAGRGPLLLLLHGFPDTAWSFAPLLPQFAEAGFRAVAPFMRGYAPSGYAPDADYRTTTLAADVPALIEALGAPQADVVGHDWGATTACVAATFYPQRLRRMVCAAVPHPRRFLFWPSMRQLVRSRYMGFFQLRGLPERTITADDFRWLRQLIRRWSPGWNFSEQDFAPLRASFADPQRLSAALAYYRALPASLRQPESRRALFRPVTVPTLMLHGAQDGCIGPEMFGGQRPFFAAEYQQRQWPDAGHFLHCEQPARFVREVLEFIGPPR